jgi:Na+/H+-dicarboxylate symporter
MNLIELRPLNYLSDHLIKLITGKLWLQVIFALLLGALLGYFLNPSRGFIEKGLSETIANWMDLPGAVFLRLVQMVMIPLVFTSIILGIVSNSMDRLKSMGGKLFIYFICTTIVAIVIGIVIAQQFEPGKLVYEMGGLTGSLTTANTTEIAPMDFSNLPEIISSLIPNNPLDAMLSGEMLGVVIFTILIGVAITQLPVKKTNKIVKMMEAVQRICMIVVSWAMLLVPYAVFGMMAALLSRIGIDALKGLSFYILLVIGGLFILLLFYMLILVLLTGRNPLRFLKAIKDVQLLAFSTASSAAVMPLTMKTADEKLNVSSKISDFVVPIGASINMDGTALFQCISALFIAQSYGLELSTTTLLLVTITIVGSSIGTPSIPGGGVIILASVLQSVGIPTEGVIVIIGVDRILGMFRTAVNVSGDLVACVVFDKWFGKIKIDTV